MRVSSSVDVIPNRQAGSGPTDFSLFTSLPNSHHTVQIATILVLIYWPSKLNASNNVYFFKNIFRHFKKRDIPVLWIDRRINHVQIRDALFYFLERIFTGSFGDVAKVTTVLDHGVLICVYDLTASSRRPKGPMSGSCGARDRKKTSMFNLNNDTHAHVYKRLQRHRSR